MSIFLKAGLWVSKKTGYKGELNLSELFSGGGNNSYSETESLTGGTWIDGKPIYRKVLPFTVPVGQSSTPLDITHNLNIETYLKTDVTSINPEFGEDCMYIYPLFGSPGGTANLSININGFVVTNRNSIYFEDISSASTSISDFLLIIEYTKI
jgi:hypothetical protein